MTFTTPLNKIVVQGHAHTNESNAAVATLKPGFLAAKGTTDDDVILCTASLNTVGWVGYESAAPAFKPANMTTAYATGDRVPIVSAKGSLVLGTLALSQTIVRGDALVAAAGGLLQKATAMSVTTGAATASAVVSTTPTISGSAPMAGSRIVAYAEQSVTTTSATATILVRSEI